VAKVGEFLGGDYIKTDQVKEKPVKFLITGTETATFDKDGGKERKLVLVGEVDGEAKKLSLGKTNLRSLIEGFGDDDDNWKGKYVVIYYDPSIMFGGKAVGGTRIKVPGVLTQAEKAAAAREAADKVASDIPF